MIRTAIVGLGKMGLSHLAILRAHPQLEVVACCDTTGYLTEMLAKYTGLRCFDDFGRMVADAAPQAILIATPTRLHAAMVEQAIDAGADVFCEKPFMLTPADGERLAAMAEQHGRVGQVGYHYRFVGAFQEAARVVASGAIGRVHHVRAEAYGPVVLRPKGSTWRSARSEGGGALYDYACHAIDLLHYVAGVPDSISGVVRNAVYSQDVDDEVYCTLHYAGGASGQLAVNWSDESHRKMSTRISIWGTNGRVVADRQECQIYLREPHPAAPGLAAGWTVRYTTELSKEVWYYLRGEEYSAQIDYWANSINQRRLDGENNFRSAHATDRVVAMITGEAAVSRVPQPAAAASRGGLFGRFIGRGRAT